MKISLEAEVVERGGIPWLDVFVTGEGRRRDVAIIALNRDHEGGYESIALAIVAESLRGILDREVAA